MNVGENVILGANLFGDHDALIYQGRRWTFAEVEQAVARAARRLRELEVQRGDRIALLLPNAPAFPVWYYAALRLGAVAVSISTRLAAEEAAYIVDDCQAAGLVLLEEDARERYASLATNPPRCIQAVVRVSELADQADGEPLTTWKPLAKGDRIDAEPDEPAVILYTSGTTGFPKGATLSHANVRSNVHAFNHLCRMEPGDRLLLAVPLFHCFGQNALLNSAWNVGACLVLQPRFDPTETRRLIREHRVNRLLSVPTTFQLLLENCTPEDLASLTYCFSAATTLPPQVSQRWLDTFGLPIYEGYGLTETSPFASYNHPLEYRLGSIGCPIDNVEMRIVDPETGRVRPPGEAGEIVIRGPNVMLGYWNRPEETDAVLRDGWFHSGDIGRMDEDGYFYIVDRLKDMIAVGGMKVFPAEVERVLLDHPAVAEAAVVGHPDEVFGEKVVAFLVPSDAAAGEAWDAEALHAYCKQHLADYKTPKRYALLAELPRNPTGKILKKVLRERRDGMLSIGGAAEEPSPQAEGGEAGRPAPAAPGPLLRQLGEVHAGQRRRFLTSWLQQQLAELLDDGRLLDPEERLLEIGLDSVLIVEFRDRLQQQIGSGCELPATLVFDRPSIAALAEYLLQTLAADAPSDASTAGDAASRARAPRRIPAPSASAAAAADQQLAAEIAAMSDEQALDELLRELHDD